MKINSAIWLHGSSIRRVFSWLTRIGALTRKLGSMKFQSRHYLIARTISAGRESFNS
jgi:hypothetical protein